MPCASTCPQHRQNATIAQSNKPNWFVKYINNLHIYIFVYVRVDVLIAGCTQSDMQNTHIHTYIHTYIQTYIQTYKPTNLHTHTHTCTCTNIQTTTTQQKTIKTTNGMITLSLFSKQLDTKYSSGNKYTYVYIYSVS